jgi:cell division protein FtsB
MKKLILVTALSFIFIASLYYGFANASKAKKLEQKLADYEAENEKYKESIEKLESKLFGIESVLRNNP